MLQRLVPNKKKTKYSKLKNIDIVFKHQHKTPKRLTSNIPQKNSKKSSIFNTARVD